MTTQINEFRASHIDVRKMKGGAALVVATDKGPVVIHMTDPAFQQLVHQTKLAQSGAQEPPAHHSDKD